MKPLPFSLLVSKTSKAQTMAHCLLDLFRFEPLGESKIAIVLGGDGFMLRCLHHYKDMIFYGIHCGTVGFLMNVLKDPKSLDKHAHESKETLLYPLVAQLRTQQELSIERYAINEISLLRSKPQASHFRIFVDHHLRLERCVGDGLIIATPAGSTAYNRSAGGPILPLNSSLIALTANNIFMPFGWRGAVLPQQSFIHIEVLSSSRRRVNATFDFFMVHDIKEISISQDINNPFRLLFHEDEHLSERILCAQFH